MPRSPAARLTRARCRALDATSNGAQATRRNTSDPPLPRSRKTLERVSVARAAVKKLPLHIRPELLVCVASHAAEQTEADADERVFRIGIARLPPCVRNIAAG